MKAVCVTQDYVTSTGGSAESVRQFEEALSATTLSFTAATLMGQVSPSAGVVHVPVPSGGLGKWYGKPDALALGLAEETIRGADVIFCHKLFRFHNSWVRRVARRWRIPYCVIPHGSLDPYVFTYRRLRKALWMRSAGRRFFRESAGLIYATRREKEKARFRLPSHRSWVVNWPVPYQELTEPLSWRHRLREKLGVAEGERVLLFMGRLHSMKQPMETMQAFARAAAAGTHLALVGPDDEYSVTELQSFSREHGIGNVHVCGPAYGEEKWAWYRAADGFLNFSTRENFGFTVAEALISGLPVILSPGNDLIADIQPADCGWFLNRGGVEESAAAIRDFASAGSERLAEMGRQGRSWARDHTSMARFQNSLSNLCQEVTHND